MSDIVFYSQECASNYTESLLTGNTKSERMDIEEVVRKMPEKRKKIRGLQANRWKKQRRQIWQRTVRIQEVRLVSLIPTYQSCSEYKEDHVMNSFSLRDCLKYHSLQTQHSVGSWPQKIDWLLWIATLELQEDSPHAVAKKDDLTDIKKNKTGALYPCCVEIINCSLSLQLLPFCKTSPSSF